ncbi:molybdenum cofactor synthesis domain-containing protein [Candidatus Latescibacterota bacterium]
MMPQVEALCISEKTGEQKREVESAELREDTGIAGDAHGGTWHRQVSLLSSGDIATVRRTLPDIKPGDFAENIIISDMDFETLGLGSRLRLGGDVVVTITQIGKACHTPCRIHYLTGDCIMPRLGLFSRVIKGGVVKKGDPVELIELIPRDMIQAVVLTISDRCSRGETVDTAGPAVTGLIEKSLGAHLYAAEIIPDEQEQIEQRLKHYCDGHSIDLVVTVGGTGCSPRDVTPEATRTVVERLTPGIDEAMRAASLAKTPHAMLSRGTSGIRGSTLIVNLPGSKTAAQENLEIILGALPHGIGKIRGDAADCGRPGDSKNLSEKK